MAFSMFLRNSACSSRIFTQQVMRLATQPSLQRAVTASLPARSLTLAETKSTPILNSKQIYGSLVESQYNSVKVRCFRTTRPRLSDEKPHDHSKLWVIERAVTAAMVPLVPIALLMPNKLLDSVLAILITAHSFWGLEAIAVDYVRASVVGPLLPKVAIALVYLVSIATLGGLFYIISHDVGVANAIRQFWSIKSQQKA